MDYFILNLGRYNKKNLFPNLEVRMKFFSLLLLCYVTLFASHIDDFAAKMSYSRDYATALSMAKKEDKVLMLLVVSNTCPWCRKFESQTLEHATIDAIIKADFIPVIVEKNADKPNFPKRYHATRIPTVYFIDPNSEELLFESMGFVRMGEYKETLEDIAKDHKGLH
jgi:hypothetical protein